MFRRIKWYTVAVTSKPFPHILHLILMIGGDSSEYTFAVIFRMQHGWTASDGRIQIQRDAFGSNIDSIAIVTSASYRRIQTVSVDASTTITFVNRAFFIGTDSIPHSEPVRYPVSISRHDTIQIIVPIHPKNTSFGCRMEWVSIAAGYGLGCPLLFDS